ncbi:putative acetyltransferase [Pseudomonas putida S610]|nr:putative acetyltransferase [Pseudomonas putida S610]
MLVKRVSHYQADIHAPKDCKVLTSWMVSPHFLLSDWSSRLCAWRMLPSSKSNSPNGRWCAIWIIGSHGLTQPTALWPMCAMLRAGHGGR